MAATVVKRHLKHEKAIVEQGKQFIALFILRTGRACVMATDTPRLRSYFGYPAPQRPGDEAGGGNKTSLIDNESHLASVQADALILDRVKLARLKTAMVSRVMNTIEQRDFVVKPRLTVRSSSGSV